MITSKNFAVKPQRTGVMPKQLVPKPAGPTGKGAKVRPGASGLKNKGMNKYGGKRGK